MSVPTDRTAPAPEPGRSQRHLSRGLVAAVTALVVLAALGGGPVGVSVASRDQSNTMMGNPQAGRSWHGGEEGFLSDMVAHHAEAIAAGGELRRSDRGEMRALGRSIVTSQTAQVDQMTTWSSDWYGEAPPESDYRPMMRDLAQLDGDRLDEVFLVDMTRHHMTAVMMARQLLRATRCSTRSSAPLARAMISQQADEIAQMHLWLNS